MMAGSAHMWELAMRPWNIAHRGGAGLRPENTLAAFQDAMTRGADGAELDVQLSRDGAVVVHHDLRLTADLARKDGVWLTQPGPRIKDMTLAQLQAYDVGRARPESAYARAHPDATWTDGESIPQLHDVVAAAKDSKDFRLLVELKCDGSDDSADPAALAEATLAVVRDSDFLARTIFVGFHWGALLRVKKMCAAAQCWFTTDRLTYLDPLSLMPLLQAIRNKGADGWFPNYEDVHPQAIADAHALDLKIAAWTVNDPADMQRLAALDAICTDRPDRLTADLQPLEQRR
jgi:glycerophosphoryl diester phosphodiesterase